MIRNTRQITLSASVSCINPLDYAEIVTSLDKAGLDSYHFDICDGHFAHTFVLSPLIIRALRGISSKRFDAHLYCTHPSLYVDELKQCGVNTIIVQYESEENWIEVVKEVKKSGLRAGLGILPYSGASDSKLLHEIVRHGDVLDLIITNTVGPAYSGQPFDARGLENLKTIRNLLDENELDIELAVDGSVSKERFTTMHELGARHFVCGTACIFKTGTKPAQLLTEFIDYIDGSIC